MGYRTYIASIPKREYNKIKSMTADQLVEFCQIKKGDEFDGDTNYWYKGVYEYGEELYEFGKYDGFAPPKKSMKPFFKNKDLMKRYGEYDFHVVTKEFLAYVIETYHDKIKSYYNDMVTPFIGKTEWDRSEFLNAVKTKYGYPNNEYEFDFSKITPEESTALYKMIEHVRSFRTEWVQLTPFNLEKGDEVNTSWKYEYAVFELVRIYKSFDWKRNVMFYYGY